MVGEVDGGERGVAHQFGWEHGGERWMKGELGDRIRVVGGGQWG